MENRKVKSNRAQADYFELLVAQYICHLYNINFNYSENLALLSNKILELPNGNERLKLQNNNLLKLAKELKDILDFEISRKGKIIKVIWTGRQLILKTTSDVDVKHINHQFTRFSIKSIAQSGTGTIKNLGMRSLKKYLGINFESEYNEMWYKLREYTGKFQMSQDELKKEILKDERLLKWATNNGQEYQIKLNKLCLEAFNNLSMEDKTKFLNFILDAEDKNLYVIIVNSKGVIVYKPVEKEIKFVRQIEAKKDSGVGYTIYINNIPTYRIQTNATNGIGISAFCQRVFFADTFN
jgi:succinate dehydrogenase flavin-adding protein (antitoxin of CptAB toxin-antitoxin module)